MSKRRSWILTVFVLIVMASVILALVFWPRKDNDKNLTEDSDQIIDQEKDDDSNEETPEKPNEVYATSLTVNLPSTINLLNGTTANFLTGYVQVLPNEAFKKLKIEIVPRYNSSAFGLEFNNSTLTAKEKGTYNLIFSVSKSASANFSKTVLITVYEEEINAHVSQVCDTITENDILSINNIFEIKASNFSVIVDDKLSYSNNIFSALKSGDSVIKLLFTENYVKYIYEFEILVKKLPQYVFVLNNITENTIEIDMNSSSAFFINYEIKNRYEGDVSQKVLTFIEDETISCIEENLHPLVKIRALNVGTTTLTLVCEADNTVQVQITIIVK